MRLIRVQQEDFDAGSLLAELRAGRSDIGASVMFIGYVRDLNLDDHIQALRLEHYPGMTEKALEEIVKASAHKNVYFVSGPELLSFSGLSPDMLHPTDHGMIEIATKLVPQIQVIINKKEK